MHDDLAWLGIRGRHLLTPFRGLHLGVVQLLPRLADPQAQSNRPVRPTRSAQPSSSRTSAARSRNAASSWLMCRFLLRRW